MGSLAVGLSAAGLEVSGSEGPLTAIPSMQHPEFQRVLERGWVSPPSFGPRGDLRIYSAALPAPRDHRPVWLASADWRRGRIQVDRRGAISDVAMEAYGGGKGKLQGEHVEVTIDYTRQTLSVTVAEAHSALGKWTERGLSVEADAGASHAVDAAFACALFLWCAKPRAFLVTAKPPFP